MATDNAISITPAVRLNSYNLRGICFRASYTEMYSNVKMHCLFFNNHLQLINP